MPYKMGDQMNMMMNRMPQILTEMPQDYQQVINNGHDLPNGDYI